VFNFINHPNTSLIGENETGDKLSVVYEGNGAIMNSPRENLIGSLKLQFGLKSKRVSLGVCGECRNEGESP
jgi:hypothetical protein